MKTSKISFYAESRLTKELCTDSAKYMVWHNNVFIVFIAIGIILTLTLPFYMTQGYSFGGAFSANVGFLPGLGLLALILYAPYYFGRKIYQRSGEKIIKMTFSAEDIVVNTGGKTEHVKYKNIKKYKRTNKYIFITTKKPDVIIYVLSKDSFKDDAIEDFLAFLSAKIEH